MSAELAAPDSSAGLMKDCPALASVFKSDGEPKPRTPAGRKAELAVRRAPRARDRLAAWRLANLDHEKGPASLVFHGPGSIQRALQSFGGRRRLGDSRPDCVLSESQRRQEHDQQRSEKPHASIASATVTVRTAWS
jgi:hypothetical protein